MTAETGLSASARAHAQREAERLINEVTGITAVVVTTIDGFDGVSVLRNRSGVEAARISALVSSMSSISAIISQAARLGNGKSVTIDTDSGFALMYNVQRPDVALVINVIANGEAVLGQVAWHTAEFARTLRDA